MPALVFRLIASLLLLTAAVRGGGFEEAGALYAAGDYAKAADACEQLIKSSGPTAARLFNLGNARYRLGQYGPAILAYERAALLAPRDNAIAANLKLAREAAKTPEPVPQRPWWQGIFYWLSLREYTWMAVCGAVLAGLAGLVSGILGWRRRLVRPVCLAGLAVGLCLTALGVAAAWWRQDELQLGIITAENPTVRLSPFATADSAGTPGTGRRVMLSERTRGWVYLCVPDSTIAGWLPESEVAPLIP